MDRLTRRLLALALAVAACVTPQSQAAYPDKPIRMLVPFPAGGAADVVARIVAQPLSLALGAKIVIDNKAGADGAIAGMEAAKAIPDGYTLLFATNTAICASPTLRKAPPYDPIADFTPVSMVGRFSAFLFVHPSLPAKSVAELLAYARNHPGLLNYGTASSTSILATAQLKLLERLDIVHVPYKGEVQLNTDLVAGRVQMAIATPGLALQHVRDGRLRVLATLLGTRSPLAPDVPTMAEAGVTQLTISPWAAVFGPARVPKEVVDRLSRAMAEVMARRDVLAQLDRYAFEGRSSTPEELRTFVRDQLEMWRRTVKAVGITPD